MDYFKNWTICICITLIISIIFLSLAPKNGVGRFFKVIISIFIFVSFLFPLMKFDLKDFEINDFDFKSDYVNVIENSSSKKIEDIVSNTLLENKINIFEVNADVSIVQNEIVINKIVVYIEKNISKKQVEQIINKELGVIADVEYMG